MVNDTGRFDEAVALTVKSGSPNVLPESAPKSMVWSALLTVCASGSDLLSAEVLSPSYVAYSECGPTVRPVRLKAACPFGARVVVATRAPPWKSETFPVGVLTPPLLTVAVTATAWPNADGFKADASTVVVGVVKLIAMTGCNSMPLGATPV